MVGWAAAPDCPASATAASAAPGRSRSWSKVRCSWTWVGWQARSGRRPAQASRRQASSSASWRRCGAVRTSSRPGLLAQRLQHRHQRRRARRGQVTFQHPRAAKRQSEPHPPLIKPLIAVAGRPGQGPRCGGASPRPAQPDPAAPHHPPPRPAGSHPRRRGWFSGNWSVQVQMCRAHDGETAPSANAVETAGWAARRFIQPTAPAAAPRVTWYATLATPAQTAARHPHAPRWRRTHPASGHAPLYTPTPL